MMKSPGTPIPIVARLKYKELVSMANKSKKSFSEVEKNIAENMHQVFADKGIMPNTVNSLAREGYIGRLLTNLVLRSNTELQTRTINNALISHPMSNKPSLYSGSEIENEVIDRAISNGANISLDERRFNSGYAATRTFLMRGQSISSSPPIIIIGCGAAGTLLGRALVLAGFSSGRMTMIDKTGSYGGLWNQKNVKDGTINSPFEFNFEGIRLAPAPDVGTKALNFINDVSNSLPIPIKGTVTDIIPGDLNHIVKYTTENGSENTIRAPIVINAIGVGTPLNPNHKGHMRTNTPGEAGIRWQQQITDEKIASKYRNAMVILIGLGNSTAEMLIQIGQLNRLGYNIDYRVITHYPSSALINPAKDFVDIHNDKKYRVFRNLKEPNLTKYEGDLEAPRKAYNDALNHGKIISNIIYWRANKNKLLLRDRLGQTHRIKYDFLFTLIGYGHDPVKMEAMGMKVIDKYRGSIATDYDGEVQRPIPTTFWKTGRDRVYPGYFALGAVAATERNPNATVIPGIMHRIYDMVFTIFLRGQEYKNI